MSVLGVKSNAAQGIDVVIKDMGIVVPSGGASSEILAGADRSRAAGSVDLQTLVIDDAHGANSSTLILEDDGTAVPQANALDFLARFNLTGSASIKDSLTATTDPTNANDNTQGYAVGSLWINTTTRAIFRCVFAGTGNAVWTLLATKYQYGVAFFGNAGSPFLSSSNTTYTILAQSVFPGTNNIDLAPDKCIIISAGSNAGVAGAFRVYDLTAALTICEIDPTPTLSIHPVHDILDLGTISNLPTGQSIFELQMRKTSAGGGNVLACFMNLYKA